MSEIQLLPTDHPFPNGVAAQDIAALGALLSGHGLSKTQVQGLMARIQKMSEQLVIVSLSEVLEDVRRIQEGRLWRIIQLIQAMPSMGGYVNRNAVLTTIHTVAAETPRQ